MSETGASPKTQTIDKITASFEGNTSPEKKNRRSNRWERDVQSSSVHDGSEDYRASNVHRSRSRSKTDLQHSMDSVEYCSGSGSLTDRCGEENSSSERHSQPRRQNNYKRKRNYRRNKKTKDRFFGGMLGGFRIPALAFLFPFFFSPLFFGSVLPHVAFTTQ